MIKAEFQKKHFGNVVTLFCGLFLIGFFIFIWNKDIDALPEDLFLGIFLGTIFCFFGILSLFYNYRAYLCIDGSRIKGKYHYFGKIDCRVSDVVYASGENDTVMIQLKNGACHTIMGIRNSREIGAALRSHLCFHVTEPPEKLIADLNSLRSHRKRGIIFVCLGMVFITMIILITVLLTGARELSEFSNTDWTVMALMGSIALAVTAATFYIASKTGKKIVPIEKLKYAIQRALVETAPIPTGNVIKVYTDEYYSGRISVYGYPNDTSVYYVVQQFDSDYALIKVFESSVFENIEELSDRLDGLIEITEKVLHR